MKGRWALKTSGKITQHMVFRIESSSCVSVVLSHLIALPRGMDAVPKSRGSLPTTPAALLPLHHHPPPELPAGFPLSSRVPGNRRQVPKTRPHVAASAERRPGKGGRQQTHPALRAPRARAWGLASPTAGRDKEKEGERNNNVFTLTVTQIQFHISLIIVLSC